MDHKTFTARGSSVSATIDANAVIRGFDSGDKRIELPFLCTTYTLDGAEAETTHLPGRPGNSFRLKAGDRSGTLSMEDGKEVSISFAANARAPIAKTGISIFLPANAVFHLAESRNIGRRIDDDMPVGEVFSATLIYNFLLIEAGGMWLRLRSDYRLFNKADVEIARHPKSFRLTWQWAAGSKTLIAAFPSMEDALKDFERLIETDFHAVKLGERAGMPDWVSKTKLVITADMMRSNWQPTHDYADVAGLAKDLKKAGCPKDTLIYIPGWHGAYDAMGPVYRPRPELGGEKGFRDMVKAIHDAGLRVMIHTTGWGIDPFNPEIDRLLDFVVRDEDGEPKGWQINEKWLPPKRALKFRTDRQSIQPGGDPRKAVVTSEPLPDWCEALVTVGGLRGLAGGIEITADRRSIHSPDGWFETHDSYDFPFPLLLSAGANHLSFEWRGAGEPAWKNAWYKLRYCFVPTNPYSSWTWPIMMADTSNPGYIEEFTHNVSQVAREFGVDAVHVDATWFEAPGHPPARQFFLELQKRLAGIPICSEAVLSFEEMSVFVFAQAATQSLIARQVARSSPAEQGGVPVRAKAETLYGWLDKVSPVCSFARKYFRSYPHLCAANAFVPVGKVCNMFPARAMPVSAEEQWEIMRDAARLDYVPGLRVNYREHGLDDATAKAIREIAGA